MTNDSSIWSSHTISIISLYFVSTKNLLTLVIVVFIRNISRDLARDNLMRLVDKQL